MLIKQVRLTNFRNYSQAELDLRPGLNIVLGENAQGKTNFLEAIEILSSGLSRRTSTESELIKHGHSKMHIEVLYEARSVEESLALSFIATDIHSVPGFTESTASGSHKKLHKREVLVNGVSYSLMKKLRGRLVTVSFNSNDLYLLRSGPSFRRDWIDFVIIRLKPLFYEQLSKYQKMVQQRNRLLKTLFDSNRISERDNDQLDVWDEQIARQGAIIVKWRLKVLHELLPKAQEYLSFISDHGESLGFTYRCQALKLDGSNPHHRPEHNYHDTEVVEGSGITTDTTLDHKLENQEDEIRKTLLDSLKKRRLEEIARGQTLSGPHRDDIIFSLNKKEATAFASQGQQRSLVLALKLSELDIIKDQLLEPPILLLDDVLAELDLKRQSLLMSKIDGTKQTIVSTTHLANFNSHWLNTANFYEVKSGTIVPSQSTTLIK